MSRRGRPKNVNKSIDFGTKELQWKRSNLQTMEPIDLCLHKGLISKSQHKSAIKLRWLYTLKFGAPTVSSADCSMVVGRYVSKHVNEEFLESMQKLYSDSIQLLDKYGSRRIVMNLCVFNEFPTFLDNPRSPAAYCELQDLQNGLEALSKILMFSPNKNPEVLLPLG